MHLRDHVREDDVDCAIRIMLESFIAAQKFSVRRTLERGFRKYLAHKRDFNELLLHLLQDLVKSASTIARIRNLQTDVIDVPLEDLETKAREHAVFDLTEFYESAMFAEGGFVLDLDRRVVSLHLTHER